MYILLLKWGFGSFVLYSAGVHAAKITPKNYRDFADYFKNLPGFLQKALAFFCEIRYA